MSFWDKLFKKKSQPAQETLKETAATAKAFMTGVGLQEIGIMFDVAGLGGGFYGHKAYKIVFEHLDPQRLEGCFVHDGDAMAISSDYYCICFQTNKPDQIEYIKQVMGGVDAAGLLPGSRRFVTGRVVQPNYLVHSGYIDPSGNFNVKAQGMIGETWADGTSWTVYRKLP